MRDDDGLGLTGVVPLRASGPSHLADVEAHWRARAEPGTLPRRRDVDAVSLGAALPQSFTIEQVAPGVARIRFAGQRLHDWFGTDPRGVPLSAIFDEAGRPQLRDALETAFDRPALVEVAITTPRGALRVPIGGRLLLLPLGGDDGRVTRALGVFGLDLAPPTGSRRFSIGEGAPRRIEPVPVGRPALVASVAGGAFAMPARAAAAPALAEGRRPWLRLVVSND